MSKFYKTEAGKQAIMDFYDAALDRWPVEIETHMVNTRYGQTHITMAGNPTKPPLILLHGSASNSSIWSHDVSNYAQAYCIYAVDVVGEPGKSNLTRPPYDGTEFADWLNDVRNALGLQSVIVGGISLGGFIALKYAVHYPSHTDALVLLNPGGITKQNPWFYLKMLPFFMLGRWGQQRAVGMLFGDFPVPDTAVDSIALIMRHFQSRRDFVPLYTDEQLMSLAMPVLVLIGEKDKIFNANNMMSRLNELIPHANTFIVPGMGHAAISTSEYVIDFLNGVEQNPTT